jgi:hypothetical protein
MSKVSKVKFTQANGTFKDMKITEVEFENGDCGNNYHKSENTKFQVGKEYIYEIGGTGKNPSIKFIGEPTEVSAPAPASSSSSAPAPKSFGKSPEESNRIARMNALTNAINLCIAQQGVDKTQNFLTMVNVFSVAQEFETFICSGVNATATAIEVNKTNAGVRESGIVKNFQEDMITQITNEQDDLPF